MQFGGRYHFSAPRNVVWAALNDTEKLRAAIPGCSRLDWSGPNTLDMELKVGLGFLSLTFTGGLELSDIVPAERYRLSGHGNGVLGMAQGAADIELADSGAGTELRFTASGGADSGIMKLGKAVLGKSAQRVIDGFFSGFGETFGAEVTALSD